ncbi:hypothetical protein FNV43_RR08471 [Rhamnella rubrinervis]|uniref:Uncharacterized protein n=1 Tax=Rhamnella rubrinervis TaxID=2594499 RepID=A0A8K0H8A4_9ROSA|nr:hypothetical protein FNV43_RR08471 [Rhamnella rubrinervis]
MASDIVFLKDEKLRQLATVIRGHEVENLKNLYFKSVGEQAKYLRICNSNQVSVETILNACGDLVSTYKDDTVRAPIAALILSHMEVCLNNALQIFTNYTLRRTYLDKITTHVDNLIKDLNDLNTSNPTDVATLTNKIQHYKEAVTNFTKMSVNSLASQEFSKNLRISGIEFQTLVKRYQANLGFDGPFEYLKEEQKLLVYDAIIEASGRGKVLNHKILNAIALPRSSSRSSIESKDISIMDAGMLLYNAATITWDVYTSDHPIQTAMRNAVKQVASKGGAVLKEIVQAAILTGLEGIAATSLFVTGIGFVVGILGSYILGEIAGDIFDLIFGSGGTKPLPNEGFIYYVADMPNGKDLAKQIANK